MERIGPQQAQQVALIALLVVFFTPVGDMIWAAGSGLAQTVIGWETFLLALVLP